MRADPHRERERQDREAQPAPGDTRAPDTPRRRRTRDATRCTGGGAASRSRASRRARARRRPVARRPPVCRYGPSRRPQTTKPPPRLSRRERTSRDAGPAPESEQLGLGIPRRGTNGSSRRETDPTSCQPGEISRPASGRPTSTHGFQGGRQMPRGSPNSSIATVPPGRTTRASSASVADRVVDVPQEVREREVVERAVRERHAFRRRLDELDASGPAGRALAPASPGSDRAR